MSTEKRDGGVVEAVREFAPALTGNPAAVWHAARRGTEAAAAALPDALGLDHVKAFVRKHPVLATCIVLAIGYYLIKGGGRRVSS